MSNFSFMLSNKCNRFEKQVFSSFLFPDDNEEFPHNSEFDRLLITFRKCFLHHDSSFLIAPVNVSPTTTSPPRFIILLQSIVPLASPQASSPSSPFVPKNRTHSESVKAIISTPGNRTDSKESFSGYASCPSYQNVIS